MSASSANSALSAARCDRDAVAASRARKPEIPLTGNDGILIRDEIELEKVYP